MKKFDFKLQKLLEIREAHERDVKNELASLVSIQNVERTKQEELLKHISSEQTSFRERLKTGAFTAKEAMLFEKFVDISRRAVDLSQDKIMEMEPGIREVRERLIQASKEKKVVEKLKEKKRAEFDYDLNREIAKENDDINQKIYLRKQHEMQAGG